MKRFGVFFASLLFSMSVYATNPVVRMETTMGNIDIELNETATPITVKNFLEYVDSGFYAQTIFHRVVKNFVVQGGGHTADMQEKPTNDPIKNEAKTGLSNLRGTIGMARTEDIDSATAQFYINTKDNVRLDYQSQEKYGYCAFGKVIAGMDIVDKMQEVPVQTVGEYENVPVEPIVLLSVKRLN